MTDPSPVATTVTGAGPSEPSGPDTRERLRARWRQWRWPLVAAAAVLLGALVTAALTRGSGGRDLDPNGTTPNGSKAVVQILRQHGVQVTTVTQAIRLPEALGGAATLVVVHPNLLGPDELTQILGASPNLVLVEPDATVLDRLAPFAIPAGLVPARTAAADCFDPDAVAAGASRAGGHLYRLAQPGLDLPVCYRDPGFPEAGTMVRGQSGRTRVSVLGQADVLRNGHLIEQGDAALALRVLGTQSRLVWFWPDPLQLAGGQEQPTLSELLPRWVPWAALQLVLAALVAIAWRARRLGRLVPEPLPVVVRAAETQEGRARLYRQARARGRAAATLRTATLRRIASRLDIPPEADPTTVVTLVADATGRAPGELQAVLLGPAPADDRTLARLADDLDAVERALGGPTSRHGRQHDAAGRKQREAQER